MPSDEDTGKTTPVVWEEACQLLFCSDGVLEAEGPGGDYFGEAGLVSALSGVALSGRLSAITEALQAHLNGVASADDASIAIVSLS